MAEKSITDFTGKSKEFECLACARENWEITLGNIVKTMHFDAHQDYEIPIPGFVIISSRRHIQSIDEFTESEQADFIKLLCRVRLAQREVSGIDAVYLFQADSAKHFHIWLFPRFDWMDEKFGTKIQSVRPIMEYARENLMTDESIMEVEVMTKKLKEYFL